MPRCSVGAPTPNHTRWRGCSCECSSLPLILLLGFLSGARWSCAQLSRLVTSVACMALEKCRPAPSYGEPGRPRCEGSTRAYDFRNWPLSLSLDSDGECKTGRRLGLCSSWSIADFTLVVETLLCFEFPEAVVLPTHSDHVYCKLPDCNRSTARNMEIKAINILLVSLSSCRRADIRRCISRKPTQAQSKNGTGGRLHMLAPTPVTHPLSGTHSHVIVAPVDGCRMA